MPIKIPDDLPAIPILKRENAFVMNKKEAEHQDIRELRILILNLMPTKIETETQLLRLLSNSPLQVEVDLLKLKSYIPKNTHEDHLLKFYKTIDEITGRKFDGMIITGAPVEHLEFEEILYWKELTEIMDWSIDNVTSILYLCWGAQAGLYHHFGIQKYMLKNGKKISGIFRHKVNNKFSELLRGFDDLFYAPHSRYSEVRREDILTNSDLELLSESNEAGIYIVTTDKFKHVFIMGHSEYDTLTLKYEYLRDIEKKIDSNIPVNYFEDDDPKKHPIVKWRGHANLLYSNWLNYAVYQTTEYNLEDDISFSHIKKPETLNIALFGLGNVGSEFIKHLLKSRNKIQRDENLSINIFAIANSNSLHLEEKGIRQNWKMKIKESTVTNSIDNLLTFSRDKNLQNLIFIDATSSEALILYYRKLIENGFDLVAASKMANASNYTFYTGLREIIKQHNRYFFYETNVGAGLPLIDTIKYLYKSGDSITKIRGVFSGSLSYILNSYSSSNHSFSNILKEAVSMGLTESDPQEDLCGLDVARKLLILSREIGHKVEIDEFLIESLIPQKLQNTSIEFFWENIKLFDAYFDEIKNKQSPNHVLQYIGEFYGKNHAVRLESIPRSSTFGQLKGTDLIFELYTERYNSNPLIIQGAYAGAETTAIGVLSDVLKLGQLIKHKVR